jgi:general secretion pathway protein J
MFATATPVNAAAGARGGAVARSKPTSPAPGAPAYGFTLVELLVAISIMTIVAIIAWRGLSSLIATRERLGPEADDVRAVLTGFGQMERDLAHAIPTLVAAGGPAVSVQIVDGGPTLRILRFSEPLPDGASAVQQVIYSVTDGVLLRQCSPPARSLQTVFSATPAAARLVPNVASMQVRVWRLNEGWVVPAPNDPTVPPGVEVVVTRSDGTTLRRVMPVG